MFHLNAGQLVQVHEEPVDRRGVRESGDDEAQGLRQPREPKLKGSIGEGSNHSNFSHQSN